MKKLEYWIRYFGIPLNTVTQDNYFVAQDTVLAALSRIDSPMVEVAISEIKREGLEKARLQKNVLAS